MHNKWRDTRVASLFLDEAELVGIESPKAELIILLVDGTTKNAAVSVVGMGGLGKTTLAKKVYEMSLLILIARLGSPYLNPISKRSY